MYIGINCDSPAAELGMSFEREFEGDIDDVSIYNRVLSATEINAVYQSIF